jgi:hypothetical protein
MSELSHDQRQAIERIMRKAEAMGLDPQRVASALRLPPAAPAEHQAVQDLQPRSWFRRGFAKRLGGRPE